MDFDIKQHLPEDFSDQSRVWIYQSSRQLLISEAFEIEPVLQEFIDNWKSHGAPVKGSANLLFGRFIIIMADETATDVGGCSTDSSVRLVKSLGEKFGVDFFNRQMLAFWIKDKIEIIPMVQFRAAVENRFINQNTLYFNNSILSKKELEEKWIIKLKSSWLRKEFKPVDSTGK